MNAADPGPPVRRHTFLAASITHRWFLFGFAVSDEETGCSVGDYTVQSRRRWNYENNCAAIVCYVSTGLATSSTQLTDMSDDLIQRHHNLSQQLTADNVAEILGYTVRKLLKAKSTASPVAADAGAPSTAGPPNDAQSKTPAMHIKIIYQVSAMPPIDLIMRTIADFRAQNAAQMATSFTVLPASSLHNFCTFLSIYGIRHE